MNHPGLVELVADELEAIVESVVAGGPELDAFGRDADAAPVRGPRDGAPFVLCFELGDATLERRAALERPGLMRCPCADL